MDNVNILKELGRTAVAAVIAFFIGLLLKAMGAGKWITAAGSGALGGMAAIAVIA